MIIFTMNPEISMHFKQVIIQKLTMISFIHVIDVNATEMNKSNTFDKSKFPEHVNVSTC